ncbi:MAG: 16S rRNA (cytosine(1402)-N(4))-methyltransferase RsmH [Candidatus Sungbacteria bacterium]|nr:16S rRNA (cytosine(1402)-N(4))-methyltransferase RsmH [Candidatus Sungbacteria bacterium]
MSKHTPVLVREIIQEFAPADADRLLDGTLGLGGHTAAYLEAGGGNVTGIELDAQALGKAQENLKHYQAKVTFVHGSYYQVKDFIMGGGILCPPLFNHILLDLGIGSHQLADTDRGFSFNQGTGLSMRYGPLHRLPPSQLDSLNKLEGRLGDAPDVGEMLRYLSTNELAQVLQTYGEEKFAYRIAGALKESAAAITSATRLAAEVSASVPGKYRHGPIHPATRTFQALRLAVNRELEVLATALPLLVDILVPGGKIAVISFHSLEDRIVKKFFHAYAKGCICPPEVPVCICGQTPRLGIITKRPIRASASEVEANPRSRSAKMRIAQKRVSSG